MKKLQLLYYKDMFTNPKQVLKNMKYIKNDFIFENLMMNDIDISKENFDTIKKSFKKMLLCMPHNLDVVKYFLKSDLQYINKKIDIKGIDKNEPILICVEKDDILKIKELYKHHLELGIKYFVFIDNGSIDGTIEFLKDKKNVDIIKSSTKYQTSAREAWINRILCHYGYNHWYLVVDSDEMYNYIGSENIKIQEHIKKLEEKGIKRELSFMLDMYSKNELFLETENFIKDCCYFDVDTYSKEQYTKFIKIIGGPRSRTFDSNGNKKEFMLGKYPLFFFEKGDIQSNSHFTFPFYKNINIPCTSVLMHYKFIGNDIEKYKKRIEEKNYSNGSEDYKVYMERYESKKTTSFYNEKSEKYIDSNVLKKIQILTEL